MIRQIEKEMVKIKAWSNANRSFMNIDQTNFMLSMPKDFFIVQTISV